MQEFFFFILASLASIIIVLLLIMALLKMDNYKSYKEDLTFARNLKIYYTVYANYSLPSNTHEKIISIVDAWQEKKWLPEKDILLLISAGYKPETITKAFYKTLDIENLRVMHALKNK